MSGARRTIAVVHNNVDANSAIGAICAWDAREALERGWAVTAVCRDLAPDLVGHVRHLPLYVPPRLHLVQWSVARPTVRAALKGWRPDVLVVQQAQLAAIADVWNVEYLSRVARRTRGPVPSGAKARVQDVQASGVAVLEDRYLRRVPDSTRMIFCSDGLREQYRQLYGEPAQSCVVYHPAFSVTAGTKDPQRRRELVGDHPGPVVGFLGGGDVRKGADLVLDAVAREPGLFLVHAGPGRVDDSDPRLQGRCIGLGRLSDVNVLLDAVDVLLVPSRFEPFGLVVAEAAAREVPVLVGPYVGAAPLVVETGAGAVWSPGVPLTPLVADLLARRGDVARGSRALAQRLDPVALADQRFAVFDAVAESKRSLR